MLFFGIWVLLGALLVVLSRRAPRRVARGLHPGLFHGVLRHAGRSLRGWNGVLQAVGVGATVLMVLFTPADRLIQDAFQAAQPLGVALPYFFLAGGNLWHLAAAGVLWAVGARRGDRSLLGAGLAAFQAVVVSGYLTLGLKLLTGRRAPANPLRAHFTPFLRSDDPGDFAFDFWSHSFEDGRFMWPSGHTAAIMAFASALVAYYPEKRWLAFALYALSLATGVAMIAGDFHWASDVVAGALLGHVFGWTAGRGFREVYRR